MLTGSRRAWSRVARGLLHGLSRCRSHRRPLWLERTEARTGKAKQEGNIYPPRCDALGRARIQLYEEEKREERLLHRRLWPVWLRVAATDREDRPTGPSVWPFDTRCVDRLADQPSHRFPTTTTLNCTPEDSKTEQVCTAIRTTLRIVRSRYRPILRPAILPATSEGSQVNGEKRGRRRRRR